jgi:D-arabinose 1-dehydrogenase-like Zn-dependent alcohol dehydrogenase
VDLETACLLPCSGLTAYSAIKKTKTSANDFLVIIGKARHTPSSSRLKATSMFINLTQHAL